MRHRKILPYLELSSSSHGEQLREWITVKICQASGFLWISILKKFKLMIMSLLFLCFVVTEVAIGQSLPPSGADLRQTSVSGVSSGAFMASQFHVAYSEIVVGAGIVAGGPYFCAGSHKVLPYLVNAMTTCLKPLGSGPDSAKLLAYAREISEEKLIDYLDNLKDDRVYIFSGSSDKIVSTKVVDQTAEFYKLANLPETNIKLIKNVNAGHAILTNNTDDTPCSDTKRPFINDCGFFQSHEILKHIYGNLTPPASSLSGQIIEFDQNEFADLENCSMSSKGYAYIPQACEKETCRIHVAFHGCLQGVDVINDKFFTKTGYNAIADTNNIIVLYPQVKPSKINPFNPLGCWDFWGYSSNDSAGSSFYTKESPQMTAVMKMIDRLSEPR